METTDEKVYPFKMTQKEVLEAVMKDCPEIHPHIEIDREWLWYCGPSLKGEEHKPTRKAMGKIGFRYRFAGARELDNGKVGTWAHHCMRPTPRKGGQRKTGEQPDDRTPTTEDREAAELRARALALIGA